MLDRLFGEVGGRVAGDDQRGVGLAVGEGVHGGKFARITTAEIDPERLAGLPGDETVRTGHIAVPAHGPGDKMGIFVEIGGEREQGAGVAMPATGHGQAHAEEQHAKAAVLHPLD